MFGVRSAVTTAPRAEAVVARPRADDGSNVIPPKPWIDADWASATDGTAHRTIPASVMALRIIEDTPALAPPVPATAVPPKRPVITGWNRGRRAVRRGQRGRRRWQ